MQENPVIPRNDGSKTHTKDRTTVVTHPIASQSTFNLDGDNNDDNNAIELETAEESDEPIEQGWVSTSREWWMVACFALMAMMVTMDALIPIPIIPVSGYSVMMFAILFILTDIIRKSPGNTTPTHQETQCGPSQSISSPTQHCNVAMSG